MALPDIFVRSSLSMSALGTRAGSAPRPCVTSIKGSVRVIIARPARSRQSMTRRIINHLSKSDAVLADLIKAVGPYRLVPQLECTLFRALAHAISHQQLHANAANAILRRFIASCGSGEFPTPEEVIAAPKRKMRAARFSLAKIAALKDLARKTLEGVVPERAGLGELEDLAIIERITQVRGIGRWTVEMMLMFQLGRPDILPVD